MDVISNADLFNNPAYSKLRESWCAGLFGVGLERNYFACEVAVNDQRDQMDADFFIRASRSTFPFQLTETQEPGRKRGLEYRELAANPEKTLHYAPGLGRLEGPNWIRKAIEKKIKKNYAQSENLHLLVYANFSAAQLQYHEVQRACRSFLSAFASIWVISSTVMCSLKEAAPFPLSGGWAPVRSLEDYYAQSDA